MANAAPDDPIVVRLPAVLDLNAASALATELSAARGKAVEINASDAQRLGAQCLQVLLSARSAWALDEIAFAITSPSDAFAEGATLMGAPINDWFNSVESAQ